MSLVDNYALMDAKHHDLASTKTENPDPFSTPKISSSVSFNNLAKVKTRNRTRSPQILDKSHENSGPGSNNPASQQLPSKFKPTTNAPKVSKKLPPAFGTIFQKSASRMSTKPSFDQPRDTNEPLQAIEQMIGAQEYKHTVGLLSPLKPKNIRNQIEDPQKLINKKHDSKRHKNPLLPLKNYLLLSKMNEDRKDVANISLEKLDKLYKVNKDNVSLKKEASSTTRSIKPNEMITLSVIKSSHETGTVKKMLHAPTFGLYAIKEVPLSTRETRNNLKEWLGQWQSNFENSPYHVNVEATFFNSPEGCLSIFMELMNAGSLHNLLESVGSLPEAIMRSVGKQLLMALDEIHTKLNTVYGALAPSQILLSKDGNIKLSLGLSNKIQSLNNPHGTLNRNLCEKTALYELTPINNPGSFQKHIAATKDANANSENKQLLFSQDVFEFGYLMLVCALGGLDFYEPNEFADKLKLFLEELNKKPQERQKYCCVIHNEELISSIKNNDNNYFSNKPVRVQKGTGLIIDKHSKGNALITIQDFLVTQNFSKDFVKFLCCCLRFDANDRYTIKQLLSSPFIQNLENKGPAVSLPELLKISIQWNKNLVLPIEYQGPSERQLNKVCEALAVVLSNCEPSAKGTSEFKEYDELLKKLKADCPEIQNLADELGLPPTRVWEHINEVLTGLNEP